MPGKERKRRRRPWSGSFSVTESKFLVDGRQFLKRIQAIVVHCLLVFHQILEHHSAVRTDFPVWNDTLLKLLDQKRPRDIQNLGRLLGRQFGMYRDQRDRVSLGHLGENAVQQPKCGDGNRDRFFRLVLQCDSDSKRLLRLGREELGQSTAGFQSKQSICGRGGGTASWISASIMAIFVSPLPLGVYRTNAANATYEASE